MLLLCVVFNKTEIKFNDLRKAHFKKPFISPEITRPKNKYSYVHRFKSHGRGKYPPLELIWSPQEGLGKTRKSLKGFVPMGL